MDVDKLAEAIISRIEHDRAIHKSSLVEEIQRALTPTWVGGQTMPNMVPPPSTDTPATWHKWPPLHRRAGQSLSKLFEGRMIWACDSSGASDADMEAVKTQFEQSRAGRR